MFRLLGFTRWKKTKNKKQKQTRKAQTRQKNPPSTSGFSRLRKVSTHNNSCKAGWWIDWYLGLKFTYLKLK